MAEKTLSDFADYQSGYDYEHPDYDQRSIDDDHLDHLSEWKTFQFMRDVQERHEARVAHDNLVTMKAEMERAHVDAKIDALNRDAQRLMTEKDYNALLKSREEERLALERGDFANRTLQTKLYRAQTRQREREALQLHHAIKKAERDEDLRLKKEQKRQELLERKERLLEEKRIKQMKKDEERAELQRKIDARAYEMRLQNERRAHIQEAKRLRCHPSKQELLRNEALGIPGSPGRLSSRPGSPANSSRSRPRTPRSPHSPSTRSARGNRSGTRSGTRSPAHSSSRTPKSRTPNVFRKGVRSSNQPNLVRASPWRLSTKPRDRNRDRNLEQDDVNQHDSARRAQRQAVEDEGWDREESDDDAVSATMETIQNRNYRSPRPNYQQEYHDDLNEEEEEQHQNEQSQEPATFSSAVKQLLPQLAEHYRSLQTPGSRSSSERKNPSANSEAGQDSEAQQTVTETSEQEGDLSI